MSAPVRPQVDEPQKVVPANGGEPEPKRPSRLDGIARLRDEIAKDMTLTLAVPGYDGQLLVRYCSIPREEVRGLMQKLQRGGDKDAIHANADFLIRCAVAVLVRTDAEKDPEPIDPDSPEPTTFSTDTLPGLIGFEADTAREEVYGLFSPGGARPFAVENHALALVNWMGLGGTAEVDQALLGK